MHKNTEAKLLEAEYPIEVIVDGTMKYAVLLVDGEETKFTLEDVAKYYSTQANNIVSGGRHIGDVYGDWRCIDDIARTLLEYFKCVNVKGLRRESRKHGIEPRF